MPSSDTYTIGPSGDYRTLTAALNDLQSTKNPFDMVFELQRDYWTGSDTFPLPSVDFEYTVRPQTPPGVPLTPEPTVKIPGMQMRIPARQRETRSFAGQEDSKPTVREALYRKDEYDRAWQGLGLLGAEAMMSMPADY